MISIADELAALDRLIRIAKHDTGQSGRCANFILAWWNAQAHGGFDLVNLWALDESICNDMGLVFGLIARSNRFPDFWGYEKDIHAIIDQWRPSSAD
jgi:hypothetical protein